MEAGFPGPLPGAGSRPSVRLKADPTQLKKIFTRAFVFLLPSNATFAAARAATIQAARDLYGTGSAVERAIAEAWTAAGVQG